jgi:hypothetical protein
VVRRVYRPFRYTDRDAKSASWLVESCGARSRIGGERCRVQVERGQVEVDHGQAEVARGRAEGVRGPGWWGEWAGRRLAGPGRRCARSTPRRAWPGRCLADADRGRARTGRRRALPNQWRSAPSPGRVDSRRLSSVINCRRIEFELAASASDLVVQLSEKGETGDPREKSGPRGTRDHPKSPLRRFDTSDIASLVSAHRRAPVPLPSRTPSSEKASGRGRASMAQTRWGIAHCVTVTVGGRC